MTVKELIKKLSSIKNELQDKEILIRSENGMVVTPEIKFTFVDEYNMDKTKENVQCVVLTA